MTDELLVTAMAIADPTHLRSSTGLRIAWADVGCDPVTGRVRFAPIFAAPFPGFRRLDILSRMVALLAEACGLDHALDATTRRDTALVLATSTGCLAADRRFAKSLQVPHGIEPAVFPYTLPSTCLGEVAIRHRLRGPTLCLSVAAGDDAAGARAAERLLRAGEARAALVFVGDWVPTVSAEPAAHATTRVAALVVSVADPKVTPHVTTLACMTPAPLQGIDEMLSAG